MAQAELIAGRREVVTSIAAAVVGQDPFDADAMSAVETPGASQEVGRGSRRLVGQLLGIGKATVVVDRDVNAVPAQSTMVVADSSAMNSMAATWPDPPEHLGVEMDELAWALTLVADDWQPRLEPI